MIKIILIFISAHDNSPEDRMQQEDDDEGRKTIFMSFSIEHMDK